MPPNHAGLWPVYELAQEVGLTVLFHSGAFGPAPGNDFARPSAFREVLLSFPVMGAHTNGVWLNLFGAGHRGDDGRHDRVRDDVAGVSRLPQRG